MNNLINLSILYVVFSISYVIPNENMQKNVNYLSSEPINKNNYIQLDIEKYYTINKILPPSFGFILTHDDMLQSMTKRPLSNSKEELINILFKNFQINDHTKTSGILYSLDASIGLDYLYKNTPILSNENVTYYSRFKDIDFVNKHDNKWNFFDLTFKAKYKNKFFFKYKFGLKEAWYNIRDNTHGYPRNFLELDNNFNHESIAIINFNHSKIFFGKNKFSLSPSENGNILLSSSPPPLDGYGFSINQYGKFTFHHLTTIIDNITEDQLVNKTLPRFLLLHRLEINPNNILRISFNEMQILNSNLPFQLLNPFKIYHNETNFSNNNIISSMDIEVILNKQLKIYSTIAIDEADLLLLEQKFDKKNKSSLGYQIGIKKYNPFNISNSKLIIEWISIDRWFYNHYSGYLDTDRNLTLTHTESVPMPNKIVQFTRYLGNPIGGDSKTLNAIYYYNSIKLCYQYIKKGNPDIYDKPFDYSNENYINNIFSYKNIIGIEYSNFNYENKLNFLISIYISNIKNYHNIEHENKIIPEINVKLNYKIKK